MNVSEFWVRVTEIKETENGVEIGVAWNGIAGDTAKKMNGKYNCATLPCRNLRPKIGDELRITVDDMSEMESESGKVRK